MKCFRIKTHFSYTEFSQDFKHVISFLPRRVEIKKNARKKDLIFSLLFPKFVMGIVNIWLSDEYSVFKFLKIVYFIAVFFLFFIRNIKTKI